MNGGGQPGEGGGAQCAECAPDSPPEVCARCRELACVVAPDAYESMGFPQVSGDAPCSSPDCPTFEEFCAGPDRSGVGVTLCTLENPCDAEGGGTPTECPCVFVVPTCGDGICNQASEECDDGNQEDGDGCDSNCMTTRCGNGVVSVDENGQPEACDDGNDDHSDGCVDCENARCGDGHLWVGRELCDDGNDVDNDECSNTCSPASRGNGVIDEGEQCDDGNEDDPMPVVNATRPMWRRHPSL